VLSSDEALYHIEGAMGNLEVFHGLPVVVVGISIDTAERLFGDRAAAIG
jgi:hypothetical protein